MKQWIKENIVPVAGVALPVLLGIVFYVSSMASVIGIDPPRTPIVYTDGMGSEYEAVSLWDVVEKDGGLYVVYTPVKGRDNFRMPTVYLFNPASGEVKQFSPPRITGENVQKPAEFKIDSFGDISLTKDKTSPDGYIFTNAERNGGFITEVFGGGRRHSYLLKKGGYAVTVPETERRWDIRMIGWVAP